LELNQGFLIQKKLKLTGEPLKIFKNTSFIKNMFNSSLEAAKFEGAAIRTVSGIRGIIKKPLKSTIGPEGSFRASFEDKLLRSDIVFLRTWYPVEPPKFYNPVTSLLLADKGNWQGMRTVGQLRRDLQIPISYKIDSEYKSITRKPRAFAPLKIKPSLLGSLPFDAVPKGKEKSKKTIDNRPAIVVDPEERRARQLLNMIHTIKNKKIEKKKERSSEKLKNYLTQKAKQEAFLTQRARKRRQDFFKSKALQQRSKKKKR